MSEIYLHCINWDDLLHNAAPLHVLWHRWLSATFFLPSISALALPVLCSLDCAIWQKHGRKLPHAMLPCATLRLHQLRVCHSSLCLSRLSFSSLTTWLREDLWLRRGLLTVIESSSHHLGLNVSAWVKPIWKPWIFGRFKSLDGIFGKNIQDLVVLGSRASSLVHSSSGFFFHATSCHKAIFQYFNKI